MPQAGGKQTYQVIQLNGANTLVNTRDDLLGDGCSINVLGVKAITEPRDTCGNLVELHAFLASICSLYSR